MTETVDVDARPAAQSPPDADTTRSTLHTSGGALAVVVLSLLSVAARLPFTQRPVSPDEGGFLMVASQWGKGTSLYGDYWVDRPPLLITLFQVADLLSGGEGLRLLGDTCVAVSVVLAATLAHAVLRLDGRCTRRPDSQLAMVGGAAAAAALLVSPLFGAGEVDGELLAVPFVLGGLTTAVTAYRRGCSGWGWWAATGALGVAAASVKQNMLEVFIVGVVLLLAHVRHDVRNAGGAAAAFGSGALSLGLGLLGWSALHGTTPAGLWDAVISFRLEAASVIGHAGPTAAQRRALGVAGAFLASGALGPVLLALAPPRRRTGPQPSALIVSLAAAVLAWECFGVAAGGSYWLHYLVGLVPGLVLAVTATGLRGRRIALIAVLGWIGVVAAAAVVATFIKPVDTPASDLAVERYLATHARPDDTGVIGFGDPALLQAAHLPSPYPQLWSLPVRVRDPGLADFTQILASPDRPTWVVVNGASLATWGVDDSRAQPVLQREYHLVRIEGDWHIYHLRTESAA